MRALLALAALIALAPCILGEEPSPAQAAPPKTDKTDKADQSIDLARQDFQALRAPGAGLESKADLPKFEMPSISYVPFHRAPSASAKSGKGGLTGEDRDGAKSGDWLLRAMQEGSSSDSASDSSEAKTRPQAEAGRQASLEEQPGQAGAAAQTASEPAKPEDHHVDNPLNAYMTQWISPREQSVLLPVAAGGAQTDSATAPGNGGSFSSNPGESIEGSVAQPLPEVEALATMRESAGPAVSGAQSPNPYLAGVEAPLGIASVQTALMPPLPAGGFLQGSDFHLGQEAPPASISGPGADVRTAVPDFAQPSDDDKYFKQLKKF